MGQYRNSYVFLQETGAIGKDKEGWNIGIRILTILLKVEMILLESAEAHLESMRKYIERTDRKHLLRERDLLIFQLLKSLERESFNFKLVWQVHSEAFKQLSTNAGDVAWAPNTPELVVFHQWFQAKVRNQPYTFKWQPGRSKHFRKSGASRNEIL